MPDHASIANALLASNLNQDNREDILQALLDSLSVKQLRVARHIITYATKSWGFCVKTYKIMSRELGCSAKTVGRTVRMLLNYRLATAKDGGCTANKISVTKELISLFNKCPRNVPANRPHTLYIKKMNEDDFDIVSDVGKAMKASVEQIDAANAEIAKARRNNVRISSVARLSRSIFQRAYNRARKALKAEQRQQRKDDAILEAQHQAREKESREMRANRASPESTKEHLRKLRAMLTGG
ncbi:MAG: hypothetical protein DRQ48_00940 [Gammaproteobacteria bacterium]|nr:MAG: hypothetical protein DRQ44_00430 [Gammaproteobacteria bacterium]RKZ72245.1 MAG: hypothetical protein DRQ48_00940 [Gammaproteobacteria bacterium]